MRTFREQLRGLELDIVSNTVYNAEQGLIPTGGRLGQLWPVTYSETHKGRYPSTYHTQECVKSTQARLRLVAGLRRLLTRLRKQILNSIKMRKLNGLKETTYGKKLNG